MDKFSKSSIVVAIAFLAVFALGAGYVVHANNATLSTDQQDYSPGQTVYITGTGWQPGATVYVSVTRPGGSVQSCSSPSSPGFTNPCTSADSSGNFAAPPYALDGIMGNYTVNANDSPYTNSAQITFTDSAANLDQCTNGAVGTTAAQTASLKEPCVFGTVNGNNYKNWVNGNANGNKAHWGEGDFISYRVTLTGLTTGSHSLVFSYDTVHSGTHSEDYLGSFDNTETTSSVSSTFHYNHNDPCVDQLPLSQCTPSAPTTSLVMTNPILANCATSLGTVPTLGPAAFAPTREFKGWGPSGFVISSMSYVGQNVVSGTGQCSTTVRINFSLSSVSSGSTVVIAWGGHIASAVDWGAGNSASAINGSPYHEALVSLDGASTGSQDRALSTTAVFFAPKIGTVIKNASGTPVTSVTAGTVVHDTATLIGASSNATGTVAYNLYTTNTCTGSQVSTTVAPVWTWAQQPAAVNR